MDILSGLNNESNYSKNQLQMILGAWVVTAAFERPGRISTLGHVEEGDYRKQSVYSLLYSLYQSMGRVRGDNGAEYELTFNTWGYAWPADWGTPLTKASDPERFGKNAYAGLFQNPTVKDYVQKHDGRVHVIEMGCGTGAGAHFVCESVLKECTYHAFDMQQAAIQTCQRKFVPGLAGRLAARRADCTNLDVDDGVADIVAVCETHVTEIPGLVTAEDRRFFATASRLLKPGGLLVWGNAIPESTWQPCFDYLDSLGMRKVGVRDVTELAVAARDQDAARVDAYVEQCLEAFWGFKLPFVGQRRAAEARAALKNFYRNPGTNLYRNMTNGTDSYKVVAFQKPR